MDGWVGNEKMLEILESNASSMGRSNGFGQGDRNVNLEG